MSLEDPTLALRFSQWVGVNLLILELLVPIVLVCITYLLVITIETYSGLSFLALTSVLCWWYGFSSVAFPALGVAILVICLIHPFWLRGKQ